MIFHHLSDYFIHFRLIDHFTKIIPIVLINLINLKFLFDFHNFFNLMNN